MRGREKKWEYYCEESRGVSQNALPFVFWSIFLFFFAIELDHMRYKLFYVCVCLGCEGISSTVSCIIMVDKAVGDSSHYLFLSSVFPSLDLNLKPLFSGFINVFVCHYAVFLFGIGISLLG